MAGEIQTKTFSGGMNKDLDYSLLKENQYIDAQNYKLISDESANGFVLENAESNSLLIDISSISGLSNSYYLVGHTYIHPYLVLFYTTNNKDASPSGGTSKIVRATIDKDKVLEASVIYDDSAVTGTLDLSTTYPIKAVGHYEAKDIIKVYWTDGYNDVRWMNIMDSNLSSYDTNLLDLVPDFPYNNTSSDSLRPTFLAYTSGAINCSAIQYAFQYYIPNGPTTVYSPSSSVIPIPKVDSTYGDQIAGGDEDEDSGYGVKMQIVTGASSFSNLRVVAIQYDTYNGNPTVRVFKEIDIDGSASQTLYITDVGGTLTELTYEDYLVQANTTFTARDLAIKDNYLFAGNITEISFDVDADCRSYRHDSGGLAVLWDAGISDSITVDDDNYPTYNRYVDVPDTHDCVNLYNNSVYDSTDDEYSNDYKYQSDGTTIGASGPNINVGISVQAGDIIDTLRTASLDKWATSTNNYGDRTWQRNEVYRIGVVFRNAKMQPSPVKWVCDFKIPSVYEDSTDYSLTNVSGGNVYSRKIRPYVTYHGGDVSWANTGATTMELVAVPRQFEDRSILAQGIVQQTFYDSSTTTYWPIHDMESEGYSYSSGGTVTSEVGLVRFISPEISFNKNLTHQSEDFLHYLGYYVWAAANSDKSTDTGINKHKVYEHTSSDSSFVAAKKKLVDEIAIVGYVADEDYRTSVDGKDYQPYVEPEVAGFLYKGGPCTTHGVISTNTDIDNTWWTASTLRIPIANYKRNVFNSQYGGLDYYSRLNNTYISVSSPDDNTAGGIAPVGSDGDTFIDWFFYYNAVNDLNKADSATEASTFLFPIETSIWTSYRLDDGILRNPGSIDALLTQEISGTHESDCVDGTTRSFVQDTALYQYNSAYSRQNDAYFYYPSSDSITTEEYSTRIKYSDHKVNGEQTDSFSIFRANNFIDLSGQYGSLNNLEVFNNQLFFWQSNGFGVASVNTRSLIEDNQPGVLALGTGGVLDRVDYLSEEIGNTNQFGISKSRTALYWVDNNKSEFFKYDGNLKSVSKLGGIQTWIHDNGQIGDVKTVYDPKYNDVLFTITFSRVLDCSGVSGDYANAFTISPNTSLSTGTYNAKINARYDSDVLLPDKNIIDYNTAGDTVTLADNPYGTTDSYYYVTIDNDPALTYTISFSELVDSFVSFHSFTPGRYIQLPTTILSSDDYQDIYIHNVIDNSVSRGTYYGITYDSEFTTVFNKEFQYTKVWDALKWYTESIATGTTINTFKDTFEQISIYNDYQHTGNRYLYYKGDTPPVTRPTEFVRRERTFSMNIPRNIVDVNVSEDPDITDSGNWDETQTFKERIRDKYIVVNTVYDNTWNGVDPVFPAIFSVPFISAVYRKSIR